MMKHSPKGTQFQRILTFGLLQTAAVVISVCCVVAYMVNNGLSKGRWAFFIFVSCLALFFAVLTTALYAANIPQRYANFNWPFLLSIAAVTLSIFLFIGSVVLSIHIDQSCMEYCVLITVGAIFAFFLTFLFLLESLFLLTKSREEKVRNEDAIVNNMESQTKL